MSPTPEGMETEVTGFGRVTAGMAVLKAIAARPVGPADTTNETQLFQQPARIRGVTRKG